MKFILAPFIAVSLCQLIKMAIAFVSLKEFSWKVVVWESFWAGKFPSGHSAYIASSLYLLIKYSADPSVHGFAIMVSLLLLYGLLEDKKRHHLLEAHLNLEMKDLQEFSGHSLTELVAGGFIGVMTTIIFDSVFV